MLWQRQTIYNDLTLPCGWYGRVIQVLRPKDFGPDWIDIGDIVFQSRCWHHVFTTEIWNVTRGIGGYTGDSFWRQGAMARRPFILIGALNASNSTNKT